MQTLVSSNKTLQMNTFLVAAATALLAFITSDAQPTERLRLRQPIAILATNSGDLLVLESYGRLLRIQAGEPHRVETLVSSFHGIPAYDIAVGEHSEHGEIIAVTRRRQVDSMTLNEISLYSNEGDKLENLSISSPGAFVVLAIDQKNGTIYTADARGREMLLISLDDGSVTGRQQLRGFQSPGPIALDEEGRVLYIVDLPRGDLYRIDLESQEIELLAEKLGRMITMAFHARTQRLYLADTQQLWIYEIGEPASPPRLLEVDGKLRQISAVTVTPSGSLWVTDQGAARLLSISPDGNIEDQIPP